MVTKVKKIVLRKIKHATRFLLSRRSIPMLKGSIAYLLTFILIFSKRFDELSQYPLAYASMMIVVIANSPGRSVGACIQGVVLAMAGVSVGCVGFVVLAKLSPWPVAQGIIFAVIVYLLALVKSRGLTWFGFSLLAILQSFNGIYISYMLGGVFSSTVLKAYYEAYLWGGAISLAVNFLVMPTSSEMELRQTLVDSLQHVGTFAHLLAKGYTLEINDEERAVRDHLNQTIRADFGYLTQKMRETIIEINYSRFSLKDYQCFIDRTRGLQQALITAHSSLVGVDKNDVELFKEIFLPGTVATFNKLRRAVDLTIREIGNELSCGPMVIPATQAHYNSYMESQRAADPEKSSPATSVDDSAIEDDESERMNQVKDRLAAEVENVTVPPTPTRGATPDLIRPGGNHSIQRPASSGENSSGSGAASIHTPTSATEVAAEVGSERHAPDLSRESESGIRRLRREFDTFSVAQHNLLKEALIGGQLLDETDDELRLHRPRGSLKDIFGTDGIDAYLPEEVQPVPQLRKRVILTKKDSARSLQAEKEEESTNSDDAERVLMDGHSLIRVWGFIFALEQFVDQLEALCGSVRPPGIKPQKRIHVHFFEALRKPHQKPEEGELSLQEALALLEQRQYTPVKLNFWQILDIVQRHVQSPTSIFALKITAAASVFATLIFASAPRPWFINYALSAGLLTIVVALAPTLGQSILTFVLQIGGSAIGYLWGLAVLEMFRGVGGFIFNPYGIVCMLIPYTLIMHYIMYERPAFFVLALLGLNGTGVLVATEWIAVEFLRRPNFDSPSLRAGKALSALAVALAIVAIFQLFILRNPARRTLRKTLAALTYQTLSYAVMMQAYGRSLLASTPNNRPPMPALRRVEKELKHRELKLQSAIIEVTPLLKFAAAEPQFSSPFKRDEIIRILRGNQVVLDRLREARAAVGTQAFEPFILTHFASILAPYRARNIRFAKTQLYLIASSLQAKAPLPHFTPSSSLTNRDRAEFIHDCLVLSARFAKTEEGKSSIRSREFMRYMSFLLCSTAIIDPLKEMEDASKEMFGELENTLT